MLERVRDAAHHLWFVASRIVLIPFLMALLGAPAGYTVFSFLMLPLLLLGIFGAATVGIGGELEAFYTVAKSYSWGIGSICGGGIALIGGVRELKNEYVTLDRIFSISRLEVSLQVQHPEKDLTGDLPEEKKD